MILNIIIIYNITILLYFWSNKCSSRENKLTYTIQINKYCQFRTGYRSLNGVCVYMMLEKQSPPLWLDMASLLWEAAVCFPTQKACFVFDWYHTRSGLVRAVPGTMSWSIHCSQCPRGHMTVWHSPSVTPPAPSQCTRGVSFCSVGWMLILNLKVVVTVRHSLVSTHLFAPLSVFLPGRQSLSIVWVCKEWAQSAQTKHWAAHFKLPDQRCVCVIWASGLQSGYFVKDVHVFSKLCLL